MNYLKHSLPDFRWAHKRYSDLAERGVTLSFGLFQPIICRCTLVSTGIELKGTKNQLWKVITKYVDYAAMASIFQKIKNKQLRGEMNNVSLEKWMGSVGRSNNAKAQCTDWNSLLQCRHVVLPQLMLLHTCSPCPVSRKTSRPDTNLLLKMESVAGHCKNIVLEIVLWNLYLVTHNWVSLWVKTRIAVTKQGTRTPPHTCWFPALCSPS